MTTPPSGPYDGQNRPQDSPQPGQYPTGPYGGQPEQYGGPVVPGQPGQYPPGQPGPGQPAPYNPYGQGAPGQGHGYGYAPPGRLAGWPIRVGASLLDSLIAAVPAIVGVIVALALDADQDQLGAGGGAAIALGYLGSFVVAILNRVVQQGRTGQSVGKKLTGLKVVHAETGRLIGVGATLGREFCAVLFNNICPLNVLWPLWDEKHQTWHDKVVSDIVIRT